MAKKDVNLYNMTNNETLVNASLDGSVGYDDALKLSNVNNCKVINCHIIGGREDAIDINRGGNHLIEGCILSSRGNFVMTIKGGAKNITIRNCTIVQQGKEVDIDLGNWSDQSQEITRYITIDNCKTAELTPLGPKPIVIRCLWADKPTILNTNHKLIIVPKWQLFLFKIFKKLLKI
jgi:hypothetical protein